MDESYKRIKNRKSTDFSVNIILVCFLFALLGLVAGTLIGGIFKNYLRTAGEILGPLMALAAFIWGLAYSRRKYVGK
jgi:hypothetical protein